MGEHCGPRVRDIEVPEREGSVCVWGKGGRNRTVPLNLDARRAIAGCLAVRPSTASDHHYIGLRGEAPKPQRVELIVARSARRAYLADVTPHLLRYGLGRHMLDAGVHLVTVSATRSAGHHP